MSEKEMALNLLDNIPAYKMGYAIAYLQGLAADELADDEYCEQLYKNYLNSNEKGQGMPLDEFAKQCGVNLDEL